MTAPRFVSMDEMLSLSFADLQISLSAPRPMVSLGAPHPMGMLPGLAGGVRSWISPNETQELDVFLVGPGARQAARTADAAGVAGVRALSTRNALTHVSDRQDFGSLEPITELAGRRERLVVTAAAGDKALTGAQASSAASLARWFRQRRPDRTGHETFELQTEEPHTRKRFTRGQIDAILRFAAAGASDAEPDEDAEDEEGMVVRGTAVDALSTTRARTGDWRSPRASPVPRARANQPRSRGLSSGRLRRGPSRGSLNG